LKLKKKRKQEVKVETPVKKIYGRESKLVYVKQRPFDDSHYPEPVDDVFFHGRFRSREYNFKDVVKFHREIHHETVYNHPEAPLMFRLDIDLKYPNRATKCQDPWKSLIEMKAPFLLEGSAKPTVLAFCRENVDEILSAEQAGAEKAGGLELLKAVQDGEVRPSDFDYVVCHPLVVTELAAIRGLLKKQFPTLKSRTVGANLPEIITTLKNGVRVKVEHSSQEPDFGYIVACVGMLNMDADALEGNFQAYVEDTLKKRPAGKDPEDFLLQCHAYTQFSFEKLRINWRDYIPK
jgi:large subunit ribosomal protein L1